MRKRIFDEDNLTKLDGFLHFLFQKGIKYTVSCASTKRKPNFTVSWYEAV